MLSIPRWLSVLLTAWVVAVPGTCTLAQTVASETPLKEIESAAEVFARGAPAPAWADVLAPQIPAQPGRKPLVVLLGDTHFQVGPPHVVVLNHVMQVNDASALAEIGRVELFFNPQFQRLTLHKVLILRGEQVIDHTTSAPVRLLQRESELERGVYSGVITVSMVLPDVRVGDTLQVVFSLEGDNPILGPRFSQQATWEQSHPIVRRRVTLLMPRERQVRWRWIGGADGPEVRPSEIVEGGLRRLTFEAHDIAAVDIEPNMPPHAQPLRWLQFSEFADWNEVARWAIPLFPADARLPDEMAPVMARLRAISDPDEKVSQALQWVQSEIRYWSIALGESSHRPRTPTEVLKCRYGDCKDKALLLVRMLTELGIEARPVLASLQAGQKPAVLLPTPEAFDHVIVQVRLGGRDLYLDPTRLGQAGLPARMGQHLENATVLPVDAAARELVTIRSPNRAEIFSSELSERFSLASFDAEGRLEVETRWSGVVAEKLRAAMQGLDADHVRSAVFGSYERRYPGIRLEGEPQIIDDRRLNVLALRAAFVVPGLARQFNGDWVVPYLAGNLLGAFTPPEEPTRHFPLVVPLYPVTATYNVEITWPAGVDATTSPASHLLETPHFSLQSTRSFRGNVERRTVQLVPKVGEVPAAELPRLRQDLHQLDYQIRSVLMAAAGDVEDREASGVARNTVLDTLRGGLTAQIERADRLLAGGQLAGEDLAMALCSRAAARVDLGAPAEGLQDALAAVRAAERSGYAWLCLGNVQFALGEFAQANAAYTRSLPLVDAPEGVTFRRGHARFYAGRLDEAAVDFARTAATATDDTRRLYALIWQATTLQRLGKPLPSDLVATAAQEPRGAWPRPALALLAGLLSVDDVLTELQLGRGDLRDFGLVEGWFYIGQHHLARARPAQAREAFERVREKGVTMYVEHIAAGFELRRLGARR